MKKYFPNIKRLLKIVYLLICYGWFFTFSGCISSESDALKSDPIFSESTATNLVLKINKSDFDLLNSNREKNIEIGDGFKVNSAKRIGDLILLNVTFSGGCKIHTFEILWDGIVYDENPCRFNLLVTHHANEDICESVYSTDLTINLKELLGDVSYKNSCEVRIFNTYNSGATANVIVPSNN